VKDMGNKSLKIVWDSNLVIMQVKDQFVCKNARLKRYRNTIWDKMEFLLGFTKPSLSTSLIICPRSVIS
jgi:hypothetical protein